MFAMGLFDPQIFDQDLIVLNTLNDRKKSAEKKKNPDEVQLIELNMEFYLKSRNNWPKT